MPKPLKIIIFDGSFKTTPFINRLVKGLAAKHQVYILGFNEKLSQPINSVHYVSLGSNQNSIKFAITTLGLLFRTKKFNFLFPTFKKFFRAERQSLQQQNLALALKDITPDIIHLQWPSVLPWFEGVLLQQKIPIVLSQRGFHSNVRPFVDERNFQYLMQWYPKIAGFHSVSKAISINGAKVWTAPKKIDKVVYTGLNLDEISFSKEYTRSQPLKILSIGRTHWKKGYDYALKSCKLLKEINLPFTYIIIGGAGDEELQFLIHDLGLQDSVQLTGRIPQQQVFKQMMEASVLLLPSLEEGVPNVVVEAMAIGLPVISTDCGGVPELITDGQDGWLVPIRDPEAMAASIVSFAKLPMERLEGVRVAARGKIETQHNGEQMVKGMEEFYKTVILNFYNQKQ